MEGTRLRGAGRLCRERPESFLAPREGNALSNLLRNDQMRRGGSRAGPEANALPHCAVESRRAAKKKVPALLRRVRLSYQRAGAGLVGNGAASRINADTPTNPPPTRQKICRQISEGTASLVMPWTSA